MQPTAQGVGQLEEKTERAPKGRKKLIPNISLVVGHVVLLEEGHIFLLKRMLPMMFLLLGDISCDGRGVRLARSETSQVQKSPILVKPLNHPPFPLTPTL